MRVMRASPSSTARPAPMRSAPETIVRSFSTSNSRAVLADAPLAVDRVAGRLQRGSATSGRDQDRAP